MNIGMLEVQSNIFYYSGYKKEEKLIKLNF